MPAPATLEPAPERLPEAAEPCPCHGGIAVAPQPAPTGRPMAVVSVSAVKSRLAMLVFAHVIVDFFSMTVVPLLSVLEGRIHLNPSQGAALFAVGSLCSGLIQPFVAAASDKYNTRIFGPLGLFAAAAALSLLGFVNTYAQLLLLQAVATAGIGAFHPVGASAMGQLAGKRRSIGIAVFFTGGMIGSTMGSLLVPTLNDKFGLHRLSWFLVPGLLGALALWIAIGAIPHRHVEANNRAASFSPAEVRRRWISVGILYSGNILRFTVNQGLVVLLVRWAEAAMLRASGEASLTTALRDSSSLLTGRMQAAMAVGMGIGGLLGGAVVRPGREKRVLIGSAIIGVPALVFYPFVSTWLATIMAICAGIGFASATPVSIAVAQRLLPHRTSFASSLMMGGAWVFSASGPLLAQWGVDTIGLAGTFAAFGLMLAVSGAITFRLSTQLLLDTAME